MSLHTSWERLKKNLLNLHAVTRDMGHVRQWVLSRSSSRFLRCIQSSLRMFHLHSSNRKRSGSLSIASSEIESGSTKNENTLLAQFWSYVKQILDKCEIESVYFWTDSEKTLHWLKSQPSSLAVFVSNRVATIQELSENISWRHVPSQFNPADIASRV